MTRLSQREFVTKKECDELIAKAIDQHNKTATMISASLGGVLLFFYADGVVRMIERMA